MSKAVILEKSLTWGLNVKRYEILKKNGTVVKTTHIKLGKLVILILDQRFLRDAVLAYGEIYVKENIPEPMLEPKADGDLYAKNPH